MMVRDLRAAAAMIDGAAPEAPGVDWNRGREPVAYRTEPYVWDGLHGRAIAPLPRRAVTAGQRAIGLIVQLVVVFGAVAVALAAINHFTGVFH